VGGYGDPAPGDDAAAAALTSLFPLCCFPPVVMALGLGVHGGRGATQSAAGARVAGSMATRARATGSLVAHVSSLGSMAALLMAVQSIST